MEIQPAKRPNALDQLTFDRRRAVQWFSPAVLARSGIKVVLAGAFGDYLDKRELQTGLSPDLALDLRGDEEIWLDYVADTGDGFNATYTVAWAMAQPELTVSDITVSDITVSDIAASDIAVSDIAESSGDQVTLPRGRLVVLGGDQVYPVATVDDYENRFVGPYKAALPWTRPFEPHDSPEQPGSVDQHARPDPADPTGPVKSPEHPVVVAIPGNHDWYDGLTGFMRVFGQDSWLGGRMTCQERSYFAIALPGRWWLWGIDIQSDAYIDVAQIRYFQRAATKMVAGDRLILCTAKPSWAEPDEDAYRNLKYVERNLVPDHCVAELMLSGDSHHYARYRSVDGRLAKITSGGGGAFVSATHKLRDRVAVPTKSPGVMVEHELEKRYPEKSTSRWLSVRALALAVRNPTFVLIPAILHLLLFMANQFGLRSVQGGTFDFEAAARRWTWLELALGRLRNPLTVVVVLTLFALLAGFAKPPSSVRGRWGKIGTRLAIGAFHTALHLAVAASVAFAATRWGVWADGFGYVAFVGAFIAVGGAVFGSIALGFYLVFALAVLKTHRTEVFSAIRVAGYKNFLRLHIEPDGRLTVYALGIDRVVKKWDVDPDNPDSEAPHLKPRGGAKVDVRLIDKTSFEPSPDARPAR